MNDTTSIVEEEVRKLMMARTGAARVQMTSDMLDAVRVVVRSSFPPGLSEIEIKERICERFYHGEVDVSAFIRALRNR